MVKDRLYKLPNGSCLLVSRELISKIHRYRQVNLSMMEQGGMLFGTLRSKDSLFTIESPPHIEICNISLPSSEDTATRTSFKRMGSHHLDELSRLNNESSTAICYIGEWHTHPESEPIPSSTDLASWRKAFTNKMAVVAIFGIKKDWWGYWARNKVMRLKELSF